VSAVRLKTILQSRGNILLPILKSTNKQFPKQLGKARTTPEIVAKEKSFEF